MKDFPRVKRKLIVALDEGRAAARAYIEALPPDLPVHADSDWTARDLIIHLTALEADMISAMQCAIEGEPFNVNLRGQPTVPDLYELRRRDRADHSWDDLLREWERARNQLRAVILAFPAELMQRPFSTPFFVDYDLLGAVGACSAHERHHLAELRAAMEGREEATEDSEDSESAE